MSDLGSTSELADLAARARAFDGHPPFSDGALAELATGARQLVWAGPAAAIYSATEAEFVVAPDFRRQGNGGRMLNLLLTQAPGDLYLWAHGGHPDARALAASRGLEPVRELLQLRRPSNAKRGAKPGAGEVSIRASRYSTSGGRDSRYSTREARVSRYSSGDADAFLALNARAFASHPEQGRLSRAEFDVLTAEPWFDPDDFLLLWEGDTLVGFCWLKVEGDLGEFYVVGVDPARQGQGLGRMLVQHGLERLAGRGIRESHLYVEGDNTAALRLYREFGFREHSVDLQYRWRSGPYGL